MIEIIKKYKTGNYRYITKNIFLIIPIFEYEFFCELSDGTSGFLWICDD